MLNYIISTTLRPEMLELFSEERSRDSKGSRSTDIYWKILTPNRISDFKLSINHPSKYIV